jgi:signal transduction histidine kinase
MLRLLNDILDTAKLEKGVVELELADFSVQEVCEQILASLRIQATKKGLDLQLQVAPAVPAYLHGDALRLQQILLNLLGNALKFTEAGRVQLRIDYERTGTGWLSLDVEDTGIGIASQHLDRIFDPFAQADASTTRRFGGTGLGTTITRQLAELMGGTISVRSTVGVGTTFTVRLPLPEGQPAPARPRPCLGWHCPRCASLRWTMCPPTSSCCKSTSTGGGTRPPLHAMGKRPSRRSAMAGLMWC